MDTQHWENSTFFDSRNSQLHVLVNSITPQLQYSSKGNTIVSKKMFHQWGWVQMSKCPVATLPKSLDVILHCLASDHNGLCHWPMVIDCISSTSSAVGFNASTRSSTTTSRIDAVTYSDVFHDVVTTDVMMYDWWCKQQFRQICVASSKERHQIHLNCYIKILPLSYHLGCHLWFHNFFMLSFLAWAAPFFCSLAVLV